MSKNPYKYSYEELQEKYKGKEFWDILEDLNLMVNSLIELLMLGNFEIKERSEKDE